jgi:hypothetical protein
MIGALEEFSGGRVRDGTAVRRRATRAGYFRDIASPAEVAAQEVVKTYPFRYA